MSISLTIDLLKNNFPELSQSEKHLLTVLCFIANQHDEVFASVRRLSMNCGCSEKTIKKLLKSLREKEYLLYTGKYTGKMKVTPVYKIDLSRGTFFPYLSEVGEDLEISRGTFGHEVGEDLGIHKDYKTKDNNKNNTENFSFSEKQKKKPTQTDLQEYAAGVAGYEWVAEFVGL